MAGAAEAGVTGEGQPDGYRWRAQIADVRNAPEYQDIVADRIWNAWWRPAGSELAEVQAALREVVAATRFPSFTLVASEGGRFVGTVTVIESDIAARPRLGPCIAALWVEAEARGRGIAAALMSAACRRLASPGFECAYLAAKPRLRAYYAARGWTLVETGIGEDNLDVFRRALP